MTEKDIICDSSAIISLTDSCLAHVIYFLKEKTGVKFLLPKSVVYECVEKPLHIPNKDYRFSALKIKDMIHDGILETVDADVSRGIAELQKAGNSVFFARGRPIQLIHAGEVEMLALAEELEVKNVLMDERTTRLLIEAPLNLKEHLAKELHVNIMVNNSSLQRMQELTRGISVIRSTEALIVAYGMGFLKHFDDIEKDVAEAALYRLKSAGCAISFKEIEEYMKGVS
jgi:predicted nucleic acid-binding protein